MNKGVANMWRYFQVGIGANLHYLTALAAVPLKGEGVNALDTLCRSRTRDGHHHARFNPLTPNDLALFRAVLTGSHTIAGFRNHDITAQLYASPPHDDTRARDGAVRAPPGSSPNSEATGSSPRFPADRLYRVTPYGQRVLSAAIAYHDDLFPTAYLAATS